jgi:surfeit locus 1 family protein
MSLRIGSRLFAPRAWSVLLTAVALAAFVSLGNWQLGRAGDKRALEASFQAGSQSTVDATGLGFEGLGRYQHVRLRGRYDGARQMLIDNMPSATGQPGYRVLTPLVRADGGGTALVDRGWVPLGASRAALPDVAVGADEREVTGILDVLPVPGLRVGPAAAPGAATWPRVLLFPTEADVESTLGIDVESRIILLDQDIADGFERRWRPALGFGPERHLGYAIQWFAFALVSMALFIALNLRQAGASGEPDPS